MLIVLFLIPLSAWAQETISSNITTETYWTSDKEYVLDGTIFVESGAALYIEAGTIIKGAEGDGNDASSLVVAKGAQIFAEGTPNNPIIFTSELDTDLSGTKNQTGLWGGVVILGNAPTNNPGNTKLIEGINEIANPESLAAYGGDDAMDNSGIFRYVSIRHTGINVGEQAGNEIQGLTLGGVGAGTTIEYVESFASADDGFEFFGGTVNTRYLVSAFVEDDSFDTDEGFVGKNQFWFAIQDNDATGRLGEHDGSSTDAEDTNPFGYPQIANATYIGAGTYDTPLDFPEGDQSQAIMIRDNSGIKFINSLFVDDYRPSAVSVEDRDGSTVDSRSRLEADSVNWVNSVFFNMTNGVATDVAGLSSQDWTTSMLTDAANTNALTDPQMKGISRTTNGELDPRIENTDLLTGSVAYEDDFFADVAFQGAFGDTNWLIGWTALSQKGYTTEPPATSVEEIANSEKPSEIQLKQNYPNPFNPSTVIEYSVPSRSEVLLNVYNVMGQKVATLVSQQQTAGNYSVSFDASQLSSGVYIYELRTEVGITTKKMTLVK